MSNISDYLDKSISSASLRNEDLLKAFTLTLASLSSQNPSQEEIRTLNDSKLYISASDRSIFVNGSDIDFLISELSEFLNNRCPEGYYFGTHIGDGANFGFWKIEEEN